MKLQWEKQSTAVKVEKLNQTQFKNPGAVEKLQYPKPGKPQSADNITPGKPGKLEYPSKKMATDTMTMPKDVLPQGKVEKLQYNQTAKFPKIDVSPKDESKLAVPYQAKGVEKGDIKKSPKQNFQGDSIIKPENIQTNKYWLDFDKVKPMQKQFSLAKDASYEDWMDELHDRGFNRMARRKFSHIWKSALSAGKDEETAARAAIESLPAEAVESATGVQGDAKSGQLSAKSSVISLSDAIGYTLVSFMKMAKECPTCMKQLVDSVNTYQYYPAIDELKKPEKEGAEIQQSGKKTTAAAPEMVRSLEDQVKAKKEELATLEKQLADSKAQPAA